MTDRLSPQREAEIAARAEAATPGPWCTDSWEIYQGAEYVPGISYWIGETCRADEDNDGRSDAAFVAHARTDVPALLAELAAVRAERDEARAELEEARRPHTPRLCACGHSHLAHTVPEPHSCFAYGQTCPCKAFQQLPHDEAVAQLERNRKAAAERARQDEEATR